VRAVVRVRASPAMWGASGAMAHSTPRSSASITVWQDRRAGSSVPRMYSLRARGAGVNIIEYKTS
jgi:hypothetical protein